jgi:hypothetical protein
LLVMSIFVSFRKCFSLLCPYHVIIENMGPLLGQVISITPISCSAQLTSFLSVSSDCRPDSSPFLVAWLFCVWYNLHFLPAKLHSEGC